MDVEFNWNSAWGETECNERNDVFITIYKFFFLLFKHGRQNRKYSLKRKNVLRVQAIVRPYLWQQVTLHSLSVQGDTKVCPNTRRTLRVTFSLMDADDYQPTQTVSLVTQLSESLLALAAGVMATRRLQGWH